MSEENLEFNYRLGKVFTVIGSIFFGGCSVVLYQEMMEAVDALEPLARLAKTSVWTFDPILMRIGFIIASLLMTGGSVFLLVKSFGPPMVIHFGEKGVVLPLSYIKNTTIVIPYSAITTMTFDDYEISADGKLDEKSVKKSKNVILKNNLGGKNSLSRYAFENKDKFYEFCCAIKKYAPSVLIS